MVRHRLGDGDVMVDMEMADSCIAADQDEAPRARALPRLLQEPEQTLDGHVHHIVRRRLAGGEVHHMGNVPDGVAYDIARGDGAAHDRHAIAGPGPRLWQSARICRSGRPRIAKQGIDEMASDLAGRTGNQHEHGALPLIVASTSIVMGGRIDAAFKTEPRVVVPEARPRRSRCCGIQPTPLLSQTAQAHQPNAPRPPVSSHS